MPRREVDPGEPHPGAIRAPRRRRRSRSRRSTEHSRSSLRSIGVEKLSSIRSNGTSQSNTRKPANIHGSNRFVRGQSSAQASSKRASAGGFCLRTRRAISASRPLAVSAKVTRNVSNMIAAGTRELMTPPRGGPSCSSRGEFEAVMPDCAPRSRTYARRPSTAVFARRTASSVDGACV